MVRLKSALNAYTIVLAYELRDTPFKVNAVDPGYTATDFNHHSGPGTVPDAAARLVKAATLGRMAQRANSLAMTTHPKRG